MFECVESICLSACGRMQSVHGSGCDNSLDESPRSLLLGGNVSLLTRLCVAESRFIRRQITADSSCSTIRLLTYPIPPRKPVLSDILPTNVRLTWKSSRSRGSMSCWLTDYKHLTRCQDRGPPNVSREKLTHLSHFCSVVTVGVLLESLSRFFS